MSSDNQTNLRNNVVLVTRPERQQSGLVSEIESLGGVAISKPLIRIDGLTSESKKTQAREKIQRLAEYDIIIFVSTNAANFGCQWIDNYWPQFPSGLIVVAIGPSTADEVKTHLYCDVLQADTGVTSEDILQLAELQSVSNKNIAIIRGVGGRELLASTLRERGASVDYIEVYSRQACDYDSGPFIDELRKQSVNVLTANSSESVDLLKQIFDVGFADFADLPLLVPSARVAEQAQQIGFKTVLNCEGASDAAFIAALLRLADTTLENET